MGLFSNDTAFRRGEKVQIKYMDIEGYIIDIDKSLYLVSYINEKDREIIDAFSEDELQKC